MIIYTIAKTSSENCGMGGSEDTQKIVKMGDYGTGDFPNFFYTHDAAEAYRNTHWMPTWWEVVELNLVLS